MCLDCLLEPLSLLLATQLPSLHQCRENEWIDTYVCMNKSGGDLRCPVNSLQNTVKPVNVDTGHLHNPQT